jgi:REP element-mobilizing transposase RayT
VTFLLTFTTYGTHLPGDRRGWSERARGETRGGHRNPCAALEAHARNRMRAPPVRLNPYQATTVLEAIRQACEFRRWELLAAHVRTEHAHAVVSCLDSPNRALAAFKAYASRALNQTEGPRTHRWAREGSTRPLCSDRAIQAAVRYVTTHQGTPMALYVATREIPSKGS